MRKREFAIRVWQLASYHSNERRARIGYIAIRLVSQIVASKKFHYFAMYTWLLGITLIVLTLTGH